MNFKTLKQFLDDTAAEWQTSVDFVLERHDYRPCDEDGCPGWLLTPQGYMRNWTQFERADCAERILQKIVTGDTAYWLNFGLPFLVANGGAKDSFLNAITDEQTRLYAADLIAFVVYDQEAHV